MVYEETSPLAPRSCLHPLLLQLPSTWQGLDERALGWFLSLLPDRQPAGILPEQLYSHGYSSCQRTARRCSKPPDTASFDDLFLSPRQPRREDYQSKSGISMHLLIYDNDTMLYFLHEGAAYCYALHSSDPGVVHEFADSIS